MSTSAPYSLTHVSVMTESICINPDCKHINSSNDLFCTRCHAELLLEGRYRVIKELGGGMSKTFEVLNVHEHKSKVLKCLPNQGGKTIELFHREFNVLSQSDHSGIPKAESFFEFTPDDRNGSLLCLVMEKIDGQDLEKYISSKGNGISESQAVIWISQLVHILAEIHQRGLLHRDIKPSNIILKPNGKLTMIDFGAVGWLPSNNIPRKNGTLVYTLGYASPEHLIGEAVYQSDFFSLGRTFVYLLTGKEIDSMQSESTDGKLQWRNAVHKNVSSDFLDLIDGLMADAITERLVNTTEIFERLSAFQQTHKKSLLRPKTTVAISRPRVSLSTSAQSYSSMASDLDEAMKKALTMSVSRLAKMSAAIVGMLALSTGGVFMASSLVGLRGPTNDEANVSRVCTESDLAEQSGNNMYGVIEIGSSGVKGEVVQRLPNAGTGQTYTLEPREEDIDPHDVDPINPKTQEETVEAVSDIFLKMQEDFSIPCEHVVLYGSSGFAAQAEHTEALIHDIELKLGRTVDLITPEDEALYVFDAIVPPSRVQDVVMLDIGSGNTKGAYLVGQDSADSRETLSIDFGTKSFTKLIDETRADQDFLEAAEILKNEKMLPEIRSELSLHRPLGSKRRIYLAGGISWSLATFMYRCQGEQTIFSNEELPSEFVRLSAEDINTFYINLTQDPDTLFSPNLDRCTDDETKRIRDDITTIKDKVFTENQLAGGAEILRALSTEMEFSDKDAIFFSRYAFEALPIGYLKQKLWEAEENSPIPLSDNNAVMAKT